MTDRGLCLAHLARGRRVEWVLLALHRPASAHVRGIAPYPLGHEPSHPERLPSGEQVVGPFGPQTVRQREVAIEMTHVDGTDSSQLVDDHVRPGPPDGLRDLIGIKRVRDDRHSTQLVEHRLL